MEGSKLVPSAVVKFVASVAWYSPIAVASGLIGGLLTYAFYRGIAPETCASLLVAAGTLYLAYWTRQSVAKTQEIISNDDNHQRTSVTIDLMKAYMWEPVQVTATLSLTPHSAVSQLRNAVKNPDRLTELKAIYFSGHAHQNEEARNQYRAITESIPVASNFFNFANELRQRDVVNLQLFMNSLAITFIKAYEAMQEVNTIVEAVPPGGFGSLEEFRAICQRWIDERKEGVSASDATTVKSP